MGDLRCLAVALAGRGPLACALDDGRPPPDGATPTEAGETVLALGMAFGALSRC